MNKNANYNTEIGDDYVTTGKVLGQGSFGKVDLCRDKSTNKTYAIKQIFKDHIIESGMGNQVKKEIYILKNLNHPNIVHIREVLMSTDSLYIVMEYVSGGELYNQIALYGTLPESKCIKYTRQICDALAFCHKLNICHRDIKPQNILVDSTDNIRLIDFGFASIMEVDSLLTSPAKDTKKNNIRTMGFEDVKNKDEFEMSMESQSVIMKKMGTICGTDAYMAPEILKHSTYMADKTDIWAFGIVVYFLLTGKMPFAQSDNKRSSYNCPSSVGDTAKDFISHMLIMNPYERYSAKKLLDHVWIKQDDDFSREELELSSAGVRMENMISEDFSDDEDVEDLEIEIPDSIENISEFINNLVAVFGDDSYSWSTKANMNMLNISTMTERGLTLVEIIVCETLVSIRSSNDSVSSSMMNHLHNIILTTLSAV